MQVTPFLMFTGAAEEAMRLYVSLFPASSIDGIERYGAEGPGREGSIKLAHFTVGGTRCRCIDSPMVHAFTFTPSLSLFVDCDDRSQLDAAFAALGDGGKVLMPPGAYGFSAWFAWVEDRYGVSWQLNLP